MKHTAEHREYIEAAAGFSWLESGHADMRENTSPAPVTPRAPGVEPDASPEEDAL